MTLVQTFLSALLIVLAGWLGVQLLRGLSEPVATWEEKGTVAKTLLAAAALGLVGLSLRWINTVGLDFLLVLGLVDFALRQAGAVARTVLASVVLTGTVLWLRWLHASPRVDASTEALWFGFVYGAALVIALWAAVDFWGWVWFW